MSKLVQQANKKLSAIAEKQSALDKLNADLDKKVLALRAKADKEIEPLKVKINSLTEKLEEFANDNRDELLEDDKKKSVKFASGEIGWRSNKEKLQLKTAASVLKEIKKLGLTKFIVTKEDINKAALIQDREAVKSIKGASIIPAEDNFFCKPLDSSL